MISVIIPTLNEEIHLPKLLSYLQNDIHDREYVKEIIVCDAGSQDRTREVAEQYGARVLIAPAKGRAIQMNYASGFAQGSVLYFLHADSFPPQDFSKNINSAISAGWDAGCFRLQFDHPHWFLKLNAWFTRFNTTFFRFGDQSLFIRRDTFVMIGGFDEQHLLMEDQEIIHRIQYAHRFIVIPGYITTSARKYVRNGFFRLQGIYYYIYFLYALGYPQKTLVDRYKQLIQ